MANGSTVTGAAGRMGTRSPRFTMSLYDGSSATSPKLIEKYVFRVNPEGMSFNQGVKGGVKTTADEPFVDNFGLAEGKLTLRGTVGRGGIGELKKLKKIWDKHCNTELGHPSFPFVRIDAPHYGKTTTTPDGTKTAPTKGLSYDVFLDRIVWDDTLDRPNMLPWSLETTVLRDNTDWDSVRLSWPLAPPTYAVLTIAARYKATATALIAGAGRLAAKKRTGDIIPFLSLAASAIIGAPNLSSLVMSAAKGILKIPNELQSLGQDLMAVGKTVYNASWWTSTITASKKTDQQLMIAKTAILAASGKLKANGQLDKGVEASLNRIRADIEVARAAGAWLRYEVELAQRHNEDEFAKFKRAGNDPTDFRPRMTGSPALKQVASKVSKTKTSTPTITTRQEPTPQAGFQRPSGEYVVMAGDTLPTIALRTLGSAAGWRSLAAINGIRSPYLLEPGQSIRLSSLVTDVTKAKTPVPPPDGVTQGDRLPADIPIVSVTP